MAEIPKYRITEVLHNFNPTGTVPWFEHVYSSGDMYPTDEQIETALRESAILQVASPFSMELNAPPGEIKVEALKDGRLPRVLARLGLGGYETVRSIVHTPTELLH